MRVNERWRRISANVIEERICGNITEKSLCTIIPLMIISMRRVGN